MRFSPFLWLLVAVIGVALGCNHDASVCVASASTIVQYNPDCHLGRLIGCGAGQYECCQYCGFDHYPDCTDHEFYIDIVQPDPIHDIALQQQECAPELSGLIADWVIYHAQNFFGKNDIELEGDLDVVVDESPPGTFVGLDELMARSDAVDPTSSTPSSTPSFIPSSIPSVLPSVAPSSSPSLTSSSTPSSTSSSTPSLTSSSTPSVLKSSTPTVLSSIEPSSVPSSTPSSPPSLTSSSTPSLTSSSTPSILPSSTPTALPSIEPSGLPSSVPSLSPTQRPTMVESSTPSGSPTSSPTSTPTYTPTWAPTTAPSASPTRSGPHIAFFDLMNADTNAPIRRLIDGETLYLADLPADLNIEAVRGPDYVGSVSFYGNGEYIRTESAEPFAYASDDHNSGDLYSMTNEDLAPRTLAIEAVPYEYSRGRGTMYPSTIITVTIDAGSKPLTESPSEPPTEPPSEPPSAPEPPLATSPALTDRVLVAEQDFDGNQKNFLSGFDQEVSGWGGTSNAFFGAGSPADWPQTRGIPANIADSTVFNIATRGLNLDDKTGVFGQNRDMDDKFFAISEVPTNITTNWVFDVAGYDSLELSIDMGGISDEEFYSDGRLRTKGFPASSKILFLVDVQGCEQTAFTVDAVEDHEYTTRLMDNGSPSGGGSEGGRLLEVYGDELITKYLAEDGSKAFNTYLDKTPPDGPGAGVLDTFTTPIACGAGSTLNLRVFADLPTEAMVFDNIKVTGVPAGATSTGLYWNSNRRQLRRQIATTTAATSTTATTTTPQEKPGVDERIRGRALYYSYWYMRQSYYGRMMCSYCRFEDLDADFYRRRRRHLRRMSEVSLAHSVHSDYEAYISFHLTRDLKDYLAENGVACMGPVADLYVYFAQNT